MRNLDILLVIFASFSSAILVAELDGRYRKPAKARRQREAVKGLRVVPDYSHPAFHLRADTSRKILPKGQFHNYEIGE